MVANYAGSVEFNRFQRSAFIVGVVALAISVAVGVALGVLPVLFRSYLVGYVFWIGMTLGCLAILLLQHLITGSWGLVIRRLLRRAVERCGRWHCFFCQSCLACTIFTFGRIMICPWRITD
ncbi:MAG: hypothetical protein WKF84_05085 [Pyrinomonadaceae bacterium]